VTLFGAVASSGHGGWEQVTRTIHMAVSRFSYGTLLNFELVVAEVSGELAYTVGDERSAVSFNGGPLQLTTLRVTHIYRRENGDWNSFTGTATPRSITALPPRRRPSRRHGQPDQLMSTLTI
jgi:ketosteroid isomerase-like protein